MLLRRTAALLAVAASAPAHSAPEVAAAKTPAAEEKICEEITLTGSRLAVKRVCASRAQWTEKRRRDRDLIDNAQRSPCVVVQTSGGKPVC